MKDYWVQIKNKRINILRDYSGIYLTRDNVRQKYIEIEGEEPSEAELDLLMKALSSTITKYELGSPTKDKFKLVLF